MKNKNNVLLIVTRDTKNKEATFIRQQLEEAGVNVFHLDASVRRTVGEAELPPEVVAKAAGMTIEQVRDLKHEGKCLGVMMQGAIACAKELDKTHGVHGIIGLGGSMGTSLATSVMKAFKYGIPKVMISTMASGMTQPFVGNKDIAMFNSVCDISGLNSITRSVFTNAAVAVAAMAKNYSAREPEGKPLVMITTMGTTDKCSTMVRNNLEERGFEVMVFHSVGAGGLAMEEILSERGAAVVLDLSLLEISEHLHGGICSAGPERGMAALRQGIPTVLVPGNIDFLVSGPIDQAKVHFPGKRYHIHNPALTAVRAEAEEFIKDAEHFAEMVKQAQGPVCFYVPLKGFSNHDSPDGHLQDTTLPPVFADRLKQCVPASVPVHELQMHINDVEFAAALVEQVVEFSKK